MKLKVLYRAGVLPSRLVQFEWIPIINCCPFLANKNSLLYIPIACALRSDYSNTKSKKYITDYLFYRTAQKVYVQYVRTPYPHAKTQRRRNKTYFMENVSTCLNIGLYGHECAVCQKMVWMKLVTEHSTTDPQVSQLVSCSKWSSISK